MREENVAALAGAYSLAMILGALFFQYVIEIPPCEMCYWQRWPHDTAIVVGLGGALLFYTHVINRKTVALLAWLALFCILVSGLIGADQALVEWKLIPGPESCTGERFVLHAGMDLNAKVVRCDEPGWRLLGISLAGYNFLGSLFVTTLGALFLTGKIRLPPRWARL